MINVKAYCKAAFLIFKYSALNSFIFSIFYLSTSVLCGDNKKLSSAYYHPIVTSYYHPYHSNLQRIKSQK